jgi:hypothetical protein
VARLKVKKQEQKQKQSPLNKFKVLLSPKIYHALIFTPQDCCLFNWSIQELLSVSISPPFLAFLRIPSPKTDCSLSNQFILYDRYPFIHSPSSMLGIFKDKGRSQGSESFAHRGPPTLLANPTFGAGRCGGRCSVNECSLNRSE